MAASTNINYAKASGIDSVPAAVIFAVLYAFLLPYYIWRATRNPTYVLIVLSLFCAIRVTAFVMRATLAGSSGAGSNINLVIGETIVYSVGFFGLLYSAYTLVLDREILSGVVVRSPLARITSSRRLIRIALIAAIALGISGSTLYNSTKQSDIDLSKTLRRVSVIIFLVVTALLAIHTALLVHAEHIEHARRGSIEGHSFSEKSGAWVLCLLVFLLLVREIYLTATLSNISHQKEGSWYPLSALPELIAVCLFATPGLVPEKRELVAHTHEREKNHETTEMA